ncbi:MAG TPA: DUF2442 domain-containing protein [Chitinivibrionales bacterium]|jgi:hypothetical protein|nr:DUF2442 domain-containing protein [Chitinivibrionales bacterium]
MIFVKNASYQTGYKIFVEFDNGDKGVVDLEGILWGEVFEPLKEIAKFRKFKVSDTFRTIVWENGADIAPEFLHDHLFQSEKSAA